MAAEILYIPAKTDDMPRFLARTNAKDAPVTALVMAAGLIQLLLILLLFTSDALNFMLDLTAALSLIPYLLAAAYALKLTFTRETYETASRSAGDMVDRGGGDGLHALPDRAPRARTSCCCPASCMRRGRFCTSLPVGNATFGCSAQRRPVLFGIIVLGAIAGVVALATGAIEI